MYFMYCKCTVDLTIFLYLYAKYNQGNITSRLWGKFLDLISFVKKLQLFFLSV